MIVELAHSCCYIYVLSTSNSRWQRKSEDSNIYTYVCLEASIKASFSFAVSNLTGLKTLKLQVAPPIQPFSKPPPSEKIYESETNNKRLEYPANENLSSSIPSATPICSVYLHLEV
jgi:hypothetical protein